MKEVYIDDILVAVPFDFVPEADELQSYVKRGKEKYGSALQSIILTPDQDPAFINIDYGLEGCSFQRIRRITGYLVGTLDRFNNGKRVEERDRVKHETRMGG